MGKIHGDYEVITVEQIWNNKTGERIEFGPDLDGIDLNEIRSYSSDGKLLSRITLNDNQLACLSRILAVYRED